MGLSWALLISGDPSQRESTSSSLNPTMAPPPPPPPPNTSASSPPPHQPLHSDDADDDDENVKQLQECSSLYLSLQECLVNSNRNWKSCQKEVQALKACHERRRSSNDRSK